VVYVQGLLSEIRPGVSLFPFGCGMDKISTIYNFLSLSEKLATAGQPLEEELETISKAGYEVVINLALSDADYSLADEEGSVTQFGMEYVHLPVIWQNPTSDDLDKFFDAMEKYKNKKLFVHCAANMRVSSFVALYRVIKEGWSYSEAINDVYRIWKPNKIWSDFIHSELSR
jgi:protein tyrosine phosphatase (PTP) superfamily phosphohydrolase (DUF442 family)